MTKSSKNLNLQLKKNHIFKEKRLFFILSNVSDPDSDSIWSVDPDLDSESGSGSRRAKMTHKNKKNMKFDVSKC